ncbi:3-phosphoshikimate 1-carboxyvinyltransferase [bacterium]|nr:3-phosphoshikimate 1-carboxyvinyltransferase [bacterium]
MQDELIIPARKILGTIELPGDKSISHRALMLGAIADGTTRIENLSDGQDVASTMRCLKQLGIAFEKEDSQVVVHGRGLKGLQPPKKELYVANSGTTIRLLSGFLAGHEFACTITGDDSIMQRPMARIVEPLEKMGAKLQTADGGLAPIRIRGGDLVPINYRPEVASAQVKSCILFAGLYADGVTSVSEKKQTRDHSERMLQAFGASVEKRDLEVSVQGPAKLQAQELYVPGDLSSAAFFIAAATLLPGSELTIRNVGINPSRRAFLTTLMEMGAQIDILRVTNLQNEIVADIRVGHSELSAVSIEADLVPQLIDEIPILAVLATQARGVTEISGAEELRVKESDRLYTISANLRRMGAKFQEKPDGFIIQGPTKLQSADLKSHGDHRIVLACSMAALAADGPCSIKNASCAEVSFPGFFTKLRELAVA